LPLPQQAKLLRAIESGVFRPIGATRDQRSDFRVVAATNERLVDLADRGAFRFDLLHRLSGIVIKVPSLSERIEDIPELARHFLRAESRLCAEPIGISDAAAQMLMATAWPGNVRELKQVVDTAAAFSHGYIDVPALETAFAHRPAPRSAISTHVDAHRTTLVAALRDASWDVDRAAGQLGLHRATLYRRMKRHGIEAPRFSGRRATSSDFAEPVCEPRDVAG
jgi:DNA-binding NtrC family response regulator